MNKTSQAPATKPKVVLIIASVLCLVSGFLPWADGSSAGPIAFIFIVSGLILLILNILALVLKKKAVNLTSNILGIIGGIITLLYSGIVFLGIFLNGALDYIDIGLWIAVFSNIVLFVGSIVSLKKDKKKSRKE